MKQSSLFQDKYLYLVCSLLVLLIAGYLAIHGRWILREPYVIVITKDSPFFNGVCEGVKSMQAQQRGCKVTFKYVPGCADSATIQQIIEEVINEHPDLIMPVGVTLSQLCVNLVSKRQLNIPIVFAGPGDPLNQGLVSALDGRAEAVTGVSLVPLDYNKPPEMLLRCRPLAKNVLLPYFPNAAGGLVERSAELVTQYLIGRGCKVMALPLYSLSDAQEKLKGCFGEADVVMYLEGCFLSDSYTLLTKQCDQYKIPLFAGDIQAVIGGAAFGYGVFAQSIGEVAMRMSYDILVHRKKTGDIPVKFMHESRKVALNLDAAEKQGLAITPELLAWVAKEGVVYRGN